MSDQGERSNPMGNEELSRAKLSLNELGVEWALLSAHENVTYVSHYEVPIDFGPLAHLNYGPVLALFAVNEDNNFLLSNNYYAGAARQQTTFEEVVGFGIFDVFEPFEAQDREKNFQEACKNLFRKVGLDRGKIKLGVEARTLPLAVTQVILSDFPNVEMLEAESALIKARSIKTQREIELLKVVAEVTNIGHKELMKQTREAGKSEFELWSLITKAMNEKAGRRLMMSGELVTGPRNQNIAPGGPIDYVTKPGDLAEFDVSPRLNGYWADMANVMVIGAEPNEDQLKFARAARDSFYAGVSQLRPGKKAKDVFAACKVAYEKYGLELKHYAGHGIGTTVNEHPWFVPTDETVLEAGMVVCIETGAYAEEATGKCEKMLIVQESGDPEIFPDFEWGVPL
jgi:Xaa-Pro aminopeptidase